ncbi:MAG: cytochrome c peroxidase [Caldilineaceae bacterium]
MDDGSLYISEVLPGRGSTSPLTAATSGLGEEDAVRTDAYVSGRARPSPTCTPRCAAVAAQGLTPNPGADQQEDDTPAAQLGQLLSFDPILSGDKNISCATRHHPVLAGADGLRAAHRHRRRGTGADPHLHRTSLLADEAGTVRRLAVRDGGDVVHNPFAGQFVPLTRSTIINSALLPSSFGTAGAELRRAAGGGTVKTKERTVNDLAMTDPLAVQALPRGQSPRDGRCHSADLRLRNALLARLLRAVPGACGPFSRMLGTADEAPPMQDRAGWWKPWLCSSVVIYTDAPRDRYLAGDETVERRAKMQGALLFGAVDPKHQLRLMPRRRSFHRRRVPRHPGAATGAGQGQRLHRPRGLGPRRRHL